MLSDNWTRHLRLLNKKKPIEKYVYYGVLIRT